MANYYGKTRTNYFRVTDPDVLELLIESCFASDDTVTLWKKSTEDGTCRFAFGCEAEIEGINISDDPDFPEYDFDDFLKKLQEILPEDEAVIITEVGSEKLRYLCGSVTVVTHNDIEHNTLDMLGRKTAREMLKDPMWDTSNEY